MLHLGFKRAAVSAFEDEAQCKLVNILPLRRNYFPFRSPWSNPRTIRIAMRQLIKYDTESEAIERSLYRLFCDIVESFELDNLHYIERIAALAQPKEVVEPAWRPRSGM